MVVTAPLCSGWRRRRSGLWPVTALLWLVCPTPPPPNTKLRYAATAKKEHNRPECSCWNEGYTEWNWKSDTLAGIVSPLHVQIHCSGTTVSQNQWECHDTNWRGWHACMSGKCRKSLGCYVIMFAKAMTQTIAFHFIQQTQPCIHSFIHSYLLCTNPGKDGVIGYMVIAYQQYDHSVTFQTMWSSGEVFLRWGERSSSNYRLFFNSCRSFKAL